MTFFSKRILAFSLCIFISASLTACQEEQPKITVVSFTTTEETTAVEITYIVNTNSNKFHRPDCPSVEQMSEHNKWEYSGGREYLISDGYKPCKRCEP